MKRKKFWDWTFSSFLPWNTRTNSSLCLNWYNEYCHHAWFYLDNIFCSFERILWFYPICCCWWSYQSVPQRGQVSNYKGYFLVLSPFLDDYNPSHPMSKSPNVQVTQCQVTQCPTHPMSNSPDFQVTLYPTHPMSNSPNLNFINIIYRGKM